MKHIPVSLVCVFLCPKQTCASAAPTIDDLQIVYQSRGFRSWNDGREGLPSQALCWPETLSDGQRSHFHDQYDQTSR